jgi:hypothetical protein
MFRGEVTETNEGEKHQRKHDRANQIVSRAQPLAGLVVRPKRPSHHNHQGSQSQQEATSSGSEPVKQWT